MAGEKPVQSAPFGHPDGGQRHLLAGFKAWLRLGYCVRKGEKGLRILAPVPLRQRREDDDPAGLEEGEGKRERRLAFTTTTVFDRAQVDPLPDVQPMPLEPPCEPLSGDSHAHLLEPLRAFCERELGYTVELRALQGAAGGWCDHEARHIVIGAGAPNAQLRVLVHETTHALGVDYKSYTREQAEVIVDGATYIVCASVSIEPVWARFFDFGAGRLPSFLTKLAGDA